MRRADVLILSLAMTYPTLATWVYFNRLAGHPHMAPVMAIGKAFQFALPIVWVALVCREPVRLPRPHARGVGLGLAFGALVLGVMAALYLGHLRDHPAFAEAPERVRAKLADLGADTPLRFLALAAFISILHSGLEEYYWRWFVFGRLRNAMPWGAALGLSSLAFMAHHVIVLDAYIRREFFWSVTMPLSLAVAVGGAAWAWLYRRTGSLYGPWASHFLADVGLMAIGWDWMTK